MKLPDAADRILCALEEVGYEAYVVGGCVRDRLMGKPPADWDICTSALPQKIIEIFGEQQTIPTGLRHGTVTIKLGESIIEVTTFRKEGKYGDSRHPDYVEFTNRVEEDLGRRDFTINAMAYHPQRGLIDPFGGERDLQAGRLVAVGTARDRFQEDPLRILRGLRLAAVHGFSLDSKTEAAMYSEKTGQQKLSAERIYGEFSKLIKGKYAEEIIGKYVSILREAIPSINPCPLKALPDNLYIRLAALLPTNTKDALEKLKCSRETIETTTLLSHNRQREMEGSPVEMKRLLRLYGESLTELIYLQWGGKESQETLKKMLQSQPCYTLKQLHVNGNDLRGIGVAPGREMGRLLETLLNQVIEGNIENNRQQLLEYIRKEQNHYE